MFARILIAYSLLLPMGGWCTPNANLPAPPTGYSVLQNSIPHGAVTASRSYPTRNAGNRLFTIYLPPGYSTATKYPVLYLLHGIGGNEVSWIGQGSNEGTAQHVMEFLYSRTLAQPMIVVMPYGNMVNTTGDTWQNFEDVLKNDLVPYIQANYSASTNPNQRGLAGLSMGGGQTLNFGFKNYTFFTWIGEFSCAPNTIAAATTIPNPTAITQNVHLSWFSVGASDGLKNNTDNYHNFFDQNNITPHVYQVEPAPLAHEKEVWNRSLYNFAQRIFMNQTPVIRPIRERAAVFSRPELILGRFSLNGRKKAVFPLSASVRP